MPCFRRRGRRCRVGAGTWMNLLGREAGHPTQPADPQRRTGLALPPCPPRPRLPGARFPPRADTGPTCSRIGGFRIDPPQPMPFVVTENCIKCKHTDCVEVCPVDCFHEGTLVIDRMSASTAPCANRNARSTRSSGGRCSCRPGELRRPQRRAGEGVAGADRARIRLPTPANGMASRTS